MPLTIALVPDAGAIVLGCTSEQLADSSDVRQNLLAWYYGLYLEGKEGGLVGVLGYLLLIH
jgi:hypothetical protein